MTVKTPLRYSLSHNLLLPNFDLKKKIKLNLCRDIAPTDFQKLKKRKKKERFIRI